MVCFMLLLVFLCGIVLISYLYYNYCIIICKSATSHKFLRSKLYIFHKNRCKTDKPVRTSQKKSGIFLCLLSHNTAPHKKKQVFFSQKICSCSTIAYNFFLCLRGYSLLPVRFPHPIFISLLIPVSFSIRSASMAAASIPLVL